MKKDPRTFSSWFLTLPRKGKTEIPLYLYKQLNKQLVLSIGNQAPEALRIYMIARCEYHRRSGFFEIAEFMDRLHTNWNFKSLSHRPGNRRKDKRRRLEALLVDSGMFARVIGGIYRFRSMSSILDTRKSLKFKVTKEDLKDKHLFHDLFYGLLFMGGAHPVSRKQISKLTGLSISSLEKITNRNHDRGRIIKQHNLVEGESFATRGEAESCRHKRLYNKISTRLKAENNRFKVLYFLGNSYHHGSDAKSLMSGRFHRTPREITSFWFSFTGKDSEDNNIWRLKPFSISIEDYISALI